MEIPYDPPPTSRHAGSREEDDHCRRQKALQEPGMAWHLKTGDINQTKELRLTNQNSASLPILAGNSRLR